MASGKKIIGDKLTEFSLRDKRNNTRERERERERGGWVDCVYLDLKKVSDKVPYERFFLKLGEIRVSGKCKLWMENY